MTAPVKHVWIALAVVYVVWGSTYFGIKIAVETIPPLLAAGSRFLVAGLLLAAILAWRGTSLRITRRELGGARSPEACCSGSASGSCTSRRRGSTRASRR